MSYTIPQIPTTATIPSNDDYFELGGLIGGSRKILANAFVLTTDARLTYNGTVTEVSASGGSTGFNFTGGPINVSGTLVLGGTLNAASGGTGATSLTGYVYGNGVNAFTASTTIPGSAITGDISVSGHFISTLSDGTYQYKLVRTGSNARTYGLAVSGVTGEFLIDDITASVPRLRIDTSGRVTIAAGINSTPIGNTTPSTGAFTTVEASHVIRTSGDAQSDQAASAAIDYSTGFARFWSWGPDTFTVGKAVVRLAKSNGTGAVEPILFKSTGVDVTGALSATGVITSTVASGTAPFSIASTTNVPNLNASLLGGKTFADPGAIGNTTASTGAFTTLTATSTVGGQGFIDRFAAPGPVGNTTASTGKFTTLEASGVITSTVASGTAPFTVTSTTNVPNLNASLLGGKTFADPGPIGTTPSTGAFTTLSASGVITSTVASGTAPFTVTSTTNVPNLNASLLGGKTFADPGAIGNTTASTGAFTTLEASGVVRTTGSALTDRAASAAIDYVSGTARLWSWGPNTSTIGQAVVRLAKSDGSSAVEPVKFKSTGVEVTGDLKVSGKVLASGSVLNRDALRAYTGMVDGQVVVEHGYSLEGDGGGGLWFFDATDTKSTDNDGTIIVPSGSYGSVATAGVWRRSGPNTYGHEANPLNVGSLDVRWFGALPKESDVCVAVERAFAFLGAQTNQYQIGCLYFPGGIYRFSRKVVFDSQAVRNTHVGFTIRGDGPGATILSYGMTVSDTCMLEFANFTEGSIQDLSIQKINYSGLVLNPSVLWIHNTTHFSILNVQTRNLISAGTNSSKKGVIRLDGNNTWISLNNLILGGDSGGTQLYIDGGSVTVSNSFFLTADSSAPCLWVASCNSLSVQDSFFQGGGPRKSFSSATITSTSTYFTVNAANHGFSAGDYCLIRDASVSKDNYNTAWKIESVTTNSFTVVSTLNLGSDTVTVSSLWSCALLGGFSSSGPNNGISVTESTFDNCLFNTGGITPSEGNLATYRRTGTVGVYLDGRESCYNANSGIGGLKFVECTMDYGNTAFFLHGRTSTAPSPVVNGQSRTFTIASISSIVIDSCGPNGGPRDYFGSFRFEGVSSVAVSNCYMAVDGKDKPSTGDTFNSVVISDGGGSAYGYTGCTQDLRFTGGIYMDPSHDADAFDAASITGFLFDGPNVCRVSVIGAGLDASNDTNSSGITNVFPVRYVNGASASHGISVIYVDNNGALRNSRIDDADIRGGNAVLSIAQCDQVKLVPFVYGGISGAYSVRLDVKTNIYNTVIGDTSFTFTSGTYDTGSYLFWALKNTSASSVNLSWPSSINWAGVSAPTSLAAGASLLLRVHAFGATTSDLFITY